MIPETLVQKYEMATLEKCIEMFGESANTEQTISIDLSKYEYVEVYASLLTTRYKATFKAKVGDTMQMCASNASYNDTNRCGYRLANINEAGVIFSTAYYNNASQDNYFIPLEIRGIL